MKGRVEGHAWQLDGAPLVESNAARAGTRLDPTSRRQAAPPYGYCEKAGASAEVSDMYKGAPFHVACSQCVRAQSV